MLGRIFDTSSQANEWTSVRSFGADSSNKDANTQNEEQELAEAKKHAKEELFGFFSSIVQSVIAFEF